jgi:branched-chain amino acid aminotransferase
MAENTVFFDGKIYKGKDIPAFMLDRGLFFGDGVFESMRCYEKKICGLNHHLDRLRHGLEVLRIPPAWDEKELTQKIFDTVEASAHKDTYVRVNVTRGAWLGSIPPFGAAEPRLMIVCRPFLGFREELYEKGFQTITLQTRRNETSPLCQIKSLNYLDNILGRMQALEQGMDEGIFLNTRGLLTEGTASNLFLVQGRRLITPPLEDGVLKGVTREIVLEKAADLNLAIEIKSIRPEEILSADEGFLTNSSLGIIGWVASDRKPVGSGQPGPVTKRMRSLYSKLLGS